MATIAPETNTTEPSAAGPAGWTRSSPTGDRAPASRARSASRRRAAAPDPPPVDARRRGAGPRPRRPRPSPPGPTRATRSAAAILRRAAEIYEAHRPEFGTWTQRETGAVHSKMHHEPNFAVGELRTPPRRCRSSRTASSSERRCPAGCRWSGACRSGSSARSRRGTRRASSGCASSRRPWPSATPSSSSPIRRRRSAAGRSSRAIFREAGLPEGAAPGRPRRRRRRRGDRHRPEHDPRVVHRVDRRGRRVGELAGGLLKKVSLELGGNNAFVVLDDADLEAAASAGAFASFQFQGQVCFATGRHIVHRSDRRRLHRPARREGRSGCGSATRTARTSTSGRSSTRSSSSASTASSAARSTPAAHARRRRHARRPVLPADGPDRRDRRTRRRGARRSSARSRRSSAFDTDEEALALANDSEYGLTGAVYSRSISRGLALAQRIRSGMVHVNDQTVNDEATIPFGGMGASGNGARFGGAANWDEFTEWQWVTVRDDAALVPVPVLSRGEMASITEVARLAGVSPATASRVVSASDYPVSAATRERVLEAARTLDYVPNALARGLLKSRVPVVAVIVHDITDPYFAEVVRGVEDAASAGRLPGHHLQLRARRRARALVRPAAALDPGGGRRVRRQRPRRPGLERGDRPSPRGDAGRRRGDRPPLAARARRARGRRRQRGRDRGDGRGARRRSGIAGSRSSPGRGRCSSPASGWPAIAAASTEAGIAVRRAAGRARRRFDGTGGALGVDTLLAGGRRRSPRSAARTTCSRSARCGGWRSSGSTSRARSRSPASTTSRRRR